MKGSPYEKDPALPAPIVARAPRRIFTWKHFSAFLVLTTTAYWVSFPHTFPKPPLSPEEREKLFLSVPTAESALGASRAFASQPHLAGSPQDFEDAKAILKVFQDSFHIHPPHSPPIFDAGSHESRRATLGLTSRTRARKPTAWIDVYYPVLNTPVSHDLEILNDEGVPVWSADLEEDGDELDPIAHKYKDSVLAWHGLSKDGVAEGQLVYANYGRKEDYDALVAAGTNLTGKIVLARYGHNFRGLKIEAAQDLGAVGVLIYSDPRDDGLVTVANGYAPYPHGPARNPTSVQRGSVQFLSKYPGDPTTPGYPSYENSTRAEGTNIPKIPSLPISWKNGERLLEEIGDGFNLNGRISKNKIRFTNRVDTKVTPIWNTMAAIPGHVPDEIVLIGNHRDAWVLGAADPTSGTASFHEVVRAFGKLLETGWRPLRTIVFASWDAEEYGLVGSTEWGEDFPEWIANNVVAYLNVDVSTSGSRWQALASPSLAHIIQKTAKDVPHPTIKGKSLWDSREDIGPYFGANGTAASFVKKCHATAGTGVGPLGSGSDYTVFLQRLGVASMDNGFGITESDAPYHYHSIYDSQRWQEVYADPGFHRHVAVGQYLGLLGLRLADYTILPLNTTQYTVELGEYLDKVEAIKANGNSIKFPELRQAIKRLQKASQALDDEKAKAGKALEDLIHRRARCHHGRFLRSVKDRVKRFFGVEPPSAEDWWKRLLDLDLDKAEGANPRFPIFKFIKAAKRVHAANKKLANFEQGFISEGGIKGREWYRHLGVAPGKYLGYGATTLPALTEAITIEKNTTLAQYEEKRLAELLDKLAQRLEA